MCSTGSCKQKSSLSLHWDVAENDISTAMDEMQQPYQCQPKKTESRSNYVAAKLEHVVDIV